jgi:hypothetical protein
MELSDYTRNPSNIDATSGASGRMQHTHHIAIEAGTVTQNPTGGFELSGPVTTTNDGSPAPLKASTLSVNIIGGTSVGFSNITLQFQGGATVHFGPQVIHGVVSSPITAGQGASPTPGTTTAVVTPPSLTTSQASVVLAAAGRPALDKSGEYVELPTVGNNIRKFTLCGAPPGSAIQTVHGLHALPGQPRRIHVHVSLRGHECCDPSLSSECILKGPAGRQTP